MDNRGQMADDSLMVHIAAMIMVVVAGAAVISLAVDHPLIAVAAVSVAILAAGLWLSHRAGRAVGGWAAEQWGDTHE